LSGAVKVIKLVQGDLLEQHDVDALVNAVNCVGVMGKGIALKFKSAWPENFTRYAAACKTGRVRPGRMLVFDAGARQRPRYLINFPTKEHWRQAAKLEFIRDGLGDLLAQVRRRQIRSLAIPALGCGNGALAWHDVRPLIEDTFRSLADVEVRLFEPNEVDAKIAARAALRRPG
jgi:O-acetyl-ADP-ribose deacetylase (regulator of RNase III)